MIRRIIHTIILPFAGLAAVLAAESCDQKTGSGGFSFHVDSETVYEGEDIPVSMTVSNAAGEEFIFSASVCSVDTDTQEETPIEASILTRAGEPVANGSSMTFPGDGHRDFRVPGLPAGTYIIRLALRNDSFIRTEGTVAVVAIRNTSSGGGEDPDRILVSDFTVPVRGDGAGTYADDGALLLPKGTYTSSDPYVFDSVIDPAGAENGTLRVSTSDPSVAAARVIAPSRLVIVPVGPGRARITVSTLDGTVVKAFDVMVPDGGFHGGTTDFSIPDLVPDENYFEVDIDDDPYSWVPECQPGTPADGFVIVSSDPSVVTGEYDPSTGKITILPHMPGYADLRIISDGGLGMSRSLPVKVTGRFVITISCVEDEATASQIKTITFPCQLFVECPTDIRFPKPVRFTFSMRATVAVKNKDLRTHVDHQDVYFYGNRLQGYNVTERVLIPAYNIYKSSDYVMRIAGKVIWTTDLDPSVWHIVVNETWRNSGSRLSGILLD